MTPDLHATCPYQELPALAKWRRSMAAIDGRELDPGVERAFRIAPEDAVATAGSCFAHNISAYLQASGHRFMVTEDAPSARHVDLARAYGYGVFTARYGTVYTARQLRQLVERAYDRFDPLEDAWASGDGVVDPYRPFIQPGGYSTVREMHIDRAFHFAAVRRMLETLDVFVFTLGLTECWSDARDGAIFGACPGCGAGEHDPTRHRFVNLTVGEVVEDMTLFLRELRRVNPDSRVILTVSPVPLVATMEPRHVLTSTVYSKSVLRVAADMLEKANLNVSYFPAYEIVSSPFHGACAYGVDRREVRPEAVRRVMESFFRHYCADAALPELGGMSPQNASFNLEGVTPSEGGISERLTRLICDEEMLDA